MARSERFEELWLQGDDGSQLCALINGERGWLMYLPRPDDPGYSSRNPEFRGSDGEMVAYRLSNGQEDHYPASWALPIADVERALAYFRKEGKPAPFVYWNNDGSEFELPTDAR